MQRFVGCSFENITLSVRLVAAPICHAMPSRSGSGCQMVSFKPAPTGGGLFGTINECAMNLKSVNPVYLIAGGAVLAALWYVKTGCRVRRRTWPVRLWMPLMASYPALLSVLAKRSASRKPANPQTRMPENHGGRGYMEKILWGAGGGTHQRGIWYGNDKCMAPEKPHG